MNMPTNTEPWIQGAAIGVIALAIVGITWGDWRHDDLRRTSPTPRMTPWSRPSHHLRRAFPGAAHAAAKTGAIMKPAVRGERPKSTTSF